jgi:hypothetical protein
MHIIFGKQEAVELENKYTVLELDTFQIGQEGPLLPAYCVVENIGILDLPKLHNMKKLHEDMIAGYQRRDWQYCLDAMEHLKGFWGGELDSFYCDLEQRINNLIQKDPGTDWSPVIVK